MAVGPKSEISGPFSSNRQTNITVETDQVDVSGVDHYLAKDYILTSSIH